MPALDLIDSLADDLAPVSPVRLSLELPLAILLGGAGTLAAVVGVFGLQPGLGTMEHGAPFLLKASYALMIGGIGLGLAATLARPSLTAARGWALLGAPVAILALLSAYQLGATPPSTWPANMLGGSWDRCPWRILLLSAPIFAALCFVVRRQAPTRLRAAGAAVGLTAGGVAASLYALACTESSATFVLVWYSLGIALASVAGMLMGPRLLRW